MWMLWKSLLELSDRTRDLGKSNVNRPSVDIVIVNWNSGRLLRECLDSVAELNQAELVLGKIVLVDNCSTDDSIKDLPTYDYNLVLIENDQNLGFAKACNLGAAEGTSDFILFLNPDSRLYPDSLESPIRFMESPGSKNVAICGARLVGEDGCDMPSCARFPTVRIFFGKMTGLSRIAPRLFPSHLLSPEECWRSREVDQVIGAFFLIRRTVFEALDGFDERFFVYFEEVDLSLRAKKKGFASYYLSDSTVFHKGRIASQQVASKSLSYSLESRIMYGFKHFDRISAALLLTLTLTLELVSRLLLSLTRVSDVSPSQVLSAYGRFVHQLLLRMRRDRH
jgi:N-acetylglucosaminyl-diphospho-decaprenol L-rhamnosyltransferase